MTTSSINILIYSYKSKNIKDTLNSIFTNMSGKHEVNVLLIDQHPLDRSDSLKSIHDLHYVHLFWDSIDGPCNQKAKGIDAGNAEYLMILGENSILYKDWDIEFVNFVKDKNIILSGNKKVKITNKNIFYIKKIFQESDNIELTQFVDRNFIFGRTEIIKKIPYPSYLKFNGEEESLSLLFFVEGIDIFSIPTKSLYYTEDYPIINTYSPFSLNHNYNEVIRLFKFGQNKYISVKNKSRTILDFCRFHGFDFSSLEPLPFYTNDVEYDPNNLNFNQVDARKFVATTKAIH